MRVKSDKHVCTIARKPECTEVAPTATCMQRMKSRFLLMSLATGWHHGTCQFIRSDKSLRMERERQIDGGNTLVWHPYSPTKYYWDCINMLVGSLALFYIPYQVFLQCPKPHDALLLSSDVISFADVISKFITGYTDVENKTVVLDKRKIALNYIKNEFAFDLIGALPLQLIQPFNNCRYPSHTMFFIFKLFRIIALKKQWYNFSNQNKLPHTLSVVCVCIFTISVYLHWITYIHYQVPAFCANFYSNSVLNSIPTSKKAKWLSKSKVDQSIPAEIKYISNLFEVSAATIGAGSPAQKNLRDNFIPEMLLCTLVELGGLLFLTYYFMYLLRLAIYRLDQFRATHRQLARYMQGKRLPHSLRLTIMHFRNHKYDEHLFDEAMIMNTINDQIKQEINMHCCKGLVMNVPFLRELPVAVLNTIIFSLKKLLYMPGETIISHGDSCWSMFLISTGIVTVYNSEGKEVRHLADGAYFCEVGVLQPGLDSESTIVAVVITETYKLSSNDFSRCLQPHQHQSHWETTTTAPHSAERSNPQQP